MWKYKKTEDMFIRNSNSEIYHSDVYLGQDFSDGFKHWRYVKKERRNGRWVYYYDTDLDNQRNILKSNISSEKKMIKNNVTYVNPETGDKFGPDHYKKAIKYDYADLAVTNAKIKTAKTLARALNAVESLKHRIKGRNILNKIKKR